MDNKKIKNATKKEYNGIQFKSLLEVMVYKTLLQKGFEPHYEASKYPIWRGFKPEVPCYKPNKQGVLELQKNKIIDITYTPDFIFMAPDNKTVIIMEIKGFQNDTYPLKEKMFGVFPHKVERRSSMLFRGADDIFMAPHSRHTEIKREDVEKVPGLRIIASSEDAGVYAIMSKEGRQIYRKNTFVC